MDKGSIIKSWSSEHAVGYYLSHRDKIEDLYKSEKYFLEEALKNKCTVLDIGCATGGFSKILKNYNKDINYTGVDISSKMIDEARNRYPDEKFHLIYNQNLDFPDDTFEVVICFGVLHMNENWKELFSEAWRVCKGIFLFDVRLIEEKTLLDKGIFYQKIEFDGKWDGVSRVPYIVLSIDSFMDYLAQIKPPYSSLKAYGYWNQVSEMTVSKYREVCMSVFCIEKEGGKNMKIIEWNLPLFQNKT